MSLRDGLEFNLQLFNDTAPAEQAAPAEQTAPVTQEQTAPEPHYTTQDGVDYYMDPNTGTMTMAPPTVTPTVTPEVTPEVTSAPAEPEPSGQNQAVPASVIPVDSTPYTFQQIMELGLENLDYSRVPDQFQPTVLDYMTKRQFQVPPQEQPAPQQPQQVYTQKQIIDILTQHVKDDFTGIYGEPFDESNYEHIEKLPTFVAIAHNQYQAELQRLQHEEVQKQQLEQQFQTVAQKFQGNLQTYKQQDANFAKIADFAEKRVEDLPLSQARKVLHAYSKLQNRTASAEDVAVIDQYYNESRMAYYQKSTGLPVQTATPSLTPAAEPVRYTPPVTMPGGNGEALPPPPLDVKNIPNDNPNALLAFIDQWKASQMKQ